MTAPDTPRSAFLRAVEIVEGMARNGRSLPKEIAAEIRAEAEKLPEAGDLDVVSPRIADRLNYLSDALAKALDQARAAEERATKAEERAEARSSEADELAAQCDRLMAERDALAGALEPFATVGRLISRRFPAAFVNDDAFRSGCAWQQDGVRKTLTWGDFRRAAAVLATRTDHAKRVAGMEPSEAEVEAAAKAEASFDKRGWLEMPRHDRVRHMDRCRVALQAAAHVRAKALADLPSIEKERP